LWISKGYSQVNKSHPLLPSLSKINPFHTTAIYLLKIYRLSRGVFPSGVSQIAACILLLANFCGSPCPSIFIVLIMLILFGEGYKF
jgi:membrane-associated phospholipid phosphatase